MNLFVGRQNKWWALIGSHVIIYMTRTVNKNYPGHSESSEIQETWILPVDDPQT